MWMCTVSSWQKALESRRMDPEIQRQFEEFDARLRAAERRILTTGNLVSKVGIPSLVDAQMKIDSLMESDTRLYGTLQTLGEMHQQLAASQQRLTESQQRLTESVGRLDESHRRLEEFFGRLADSHWRLEESVGRLADSH